MVKYSATHELVEKTGPKIVLISLKNIKINRATYMLSWYLLL
jgi:hypothetical protein